MVGQIGTGTFTLENEVFIIPSGARNIDLNNSGAAIGKFKGNQTITSADGSSSKEPTFVNLAVKEAYSFAIAEKPYGDITIDATGTKIEVSVNY